MTWFAEMRRSLELSRAQRVPFDRAWLVALDAHPFVPNEGFGMTPDVREFTRKHMRAAYYNDGTKMGRMRASTRVVDEAVGLLRVADVGVWEAA